MPEEAHMAEYRQPVEGEGPHQGETEADHVSPDEQEEVTDDVADKARAAR